MNENGQASASHENDVYIPADIIQVMVRAYETLASAKFSDMSVGDMVPIVMTTSAMTQMMKYIKESDQQQKVNLQM